MKRLKPILLFLCIVFCMAIVSNCAKNSGAIPKVATDCDTVSYATDIAPIMATKCAKTGGCHGDIPPPKNVYLNTYEEVRLQAENGNIKKWVIDGNSGTMPPTGKLPADELALIDCWLKNGYKP